MKFSDLTPADINALRVLAALEIAYPEQALAQGARAASVVLRGWGERKKRRGSAQSQPSGVRPPDDTGHDQQHSNGGAV